ncbi:MAG: transcription termination factor NusA [Candidatus Dormibacteraeota bacterium]|uniref:Transcription termination/antitermination protein NusA n=1 Tax=Candidatus Dormiibacter inghamiae TaxID=3127013 RepID=A0A934KHE0_9BACT|nr:transcription termination factor NusA [Candidatus Dormibacteraeota bacterium]MBJ7607446.1 transcription termination factor NusA [Candidatus Dormibacteraeota bacterium]
MSTAPENLLNALEQLSGDVGVPLNELQRTVEGALAMAYQRAFTPEGAVIVRLNPETAELSVSERFVDAAGEVVERELPVADFKRLAAQTARTAVLRKLRDLERDRALSDMSRNRGRLASGFVDRLTGGNVFVDLGKVEGFLPPEEQIPGEQLSVGRPLTVLVLDSLPSPKHAQVLVSRASRMFVARLLEAEVPEIAVGVVEIKSIARDAGLRTKVAVASGEAGIDPVGACVGPKAVRHRSLLQELGGEHVDIVTWHAEPERFVASALRPAAVLEVQLDPDGRTAHVRVAKGELSLAIGKDGQNARLAARLTGWRIDIQA